MQPLVTIITATYNCEDEIEDTIANVVDLKDKYNFLEYIVVDGGSSDGTMTFVEASCAVDDFVSERDSGIGDAWNKGLKMASGQYVCLLNAGDILHEDFISDHLDNYQEGSIGYGRTNMFSDGRITNVIDKKFDGIFANGFGFLHTSCFASKKVYDKVGYFDLSYKIALDTEWLMRALACGVDLRKTQSVNYMRAGGVSEKRYMAAQIEYGRALKEHGRISDMAERVRLLKHLSYYVLRKIGVFRFTKRLKLEMWHVFIFFLNTCLRLSPWPSANNIILQIIGFKIGKGTSFHRGLRVFSVKNVVVGENCVINRGCCFDNRARISIGSNVSLSHEVRIYTTGHDIEERFFGAKKKEVKVGDHVVVFAGAVIMPGVSLGAGSVVLPFSIVTKDVSENEIVGGNPAEVKGVRSLKPRYSLYYPYMFGS